MRYLLDTSSYLWILNDPKKLSEKSLNILKNPDNEINISIVSFWEISLKYSLGKLDLNDFIPEDLYNEATRIGIKCIGIDFPEVLTFYKLDILHKDPFDRLIIWQAINRNFTLISSDKMFRQYKKYGLKTEW